MYSIKTSQAVRILAAAVFGIVFLAGAVYAADQKSGDPDMMAENVLDMSIRTKSGDDVGEITNVLFERNGKIKEYLVDVGGFLGIGEKTVAVSPQDLTYDADKGYAVFQGSKKELEDRPEVDYQSYGYGRDAYRNRPYAGSRYGYGSGYYPPPPLYSYGPYD
ncbi:MAG: PRC-barrel domain-containing protein, partial [Desulfobacterales bacterium]